MQQQSSVSRLLFCLFSLITDTFIPCSISVKEDGEKVEVYTSAAVLEEVRLTQGGMVLIALLSGGDYDKVTC